MFRRQLSIRLSLASSLVFCRAEPVVPALKAPDGARKLVEAGIVPVAVLGVLSQGLSQQQSDQTVQTRGLIEAL